MSLDYLEQIAVIPNIATTLDEEVLEQIGTDVVQEYEADDNSRSEWLEKQEDAMNLASQLVEPKAYPWPNAANVKYPIMTEAAVQFNARAYPALIPNVNIVKGRPVGEDPDGRKMNQAIRVSKHMSYQILEEMEEWEEEMDRLLLVLPVLGCMFKKTYFDPILGRNKSEAVMPKDLVINYQAKNLASAHRKTHVLHYTQNEINQYVAQGLWLEQDLGQANINSDYGADQREGMSHTLTSDADNFTILEQHRYEDLDQDGIAEPYIVTVDLGTSKVMRVVACYDTEQIVLNEDTGDVVLVPQIQYFTKYGFIPNPDGGFYDVGFGQLLGPINHTVDTIINQLLDAGTMSNLQAGFLSRGVRVKGGNMRFGPGEWKTVQATGDDLRKGIFPLPTREPSNVLFQLLGMMVNAAQRVAGTIDSMVGENPGQNQKATTTMAVLDQGQKVFSGIYKRLHRSFKQELRKLFRLNAQYLSPEDYFNVLDMPEGMESAALIMQEDYNLESVNIIPTADSNVATQQQKLAKAGALMEKLQFGMLNPQEVMKRVLEAEEQPAVELLLNYNPPPNPELVLKQEEIKIKWAEIELDSIKTEQQEIKTQAEVIKLLADAEGVDEGTQLQQYKLQLDELKQRADITSARMSSMQKGSQQ